ncbi:MAG TPA: hypothetical protein VHB98_21360 [Chloroflexota bacterium]|nr:hypothetical protein [Chloroflexota bacterium]
MIIPSAPAGPVANTIESYPICVRCKEPVIANRDRYEVFEKMHYLCFHLTFEHNAYGDFDPD